MRAKRRKLLVGDDDFYYTEETRLGDMLKMMDIADLAGGALRYMGVLQHYEGDSRVVH